MSGEIPRPLRSIALVAAVLMSGAGVTVPARAADCLAAPNSPAPQGSHWYYRLNWATQHKCWYVRPPGRPLQQAAAPAALARVTPEHSLAAGSRPTGATDGDPISESSSDSPPSSPHVTTLAVKPTSAQEITATDDKLAQRNVQEGNTALSTIEVPALRANTSSQDNAQAGAPPVAPVAWPDAPPAVQAQAPVAVPIDTPAAAMSVGAERTDRGSKPINNVGIPIITFPILALGLTVVGILYIKIAAAHRARTIMGHAEPDMVGDLRRHEGRDDDQQQGSVDEWGEYQSLISAVSDPLRAEDSADQITPEIRKRRDKLAQLHQRLDRLLQSPTPA
jgi:hypothetical protein